jgi:hypothetical protein
MHLSTVQGPRRRTRSVLVVGGGLLLVLLGLGFALQSRAHLSASSPTVPAQPTVDPQTEPNELSPKSNIGVAEKPRLLRSS